MAVSTDQHITGRKKIVKEEKHALPRTALFLRLRDNGQVGDV